MANRSTEPSNLTRQALAFAHELGLDLISVAPAGPPVTADHYRAWIAQGYHGEMAYLARPDALDRRLDLGHTLPGVRTVVTVAVNYYPGALDSERSLDASRGLIARFARASDYHEVLLERLSRLAEFLAGEVDHPFQWRAYVDTGPLLEREIAWQAGLGFIGKNTQLIQPRLGSWLLLGELLLSVDLEPGLSLSGTGHGPFAAAARGSCGQCSRCLEACPTRALVAPFVLDARRCISYLTIELKGFIPQELRTLMGNRIFGCDLCQEVCPWNRRFARPTSDPALRPRTGDDDGWTCEDSTAPRLLDLMALDADGFRRRFGDSPVRRARRRGLLRNVAVALGNWADPATVPLLVQALGDAEPVIRGHAAWALGRIAVPQARRALEKALPVEPDERVRMELAQALA